LSQKRYSSVITPLSHTPIVAIGMLNDLPVGGIVIPFGRGIGFVNVPSKVPVTAVYYPSPILIGCAVTRVSGA
jgi:hypothetical protein